MYISNTRIPKEVIHKYLSKMFDSYKTHAYSNVFIIFFFFVTVIIC